MPLQSSVSFHLNEQDCIGCLHANTHAWPFIWSVPKAGYSKGSIICALVDVAVRRIVLRLAFVALSLVLHANVHHCA